MLNNNLNNDWLNSIEINITNHMQIQAERVLNPLGYHLSQEAKKRLRWLYILYYEQDSNVTKAANKIGLSRPWLSFIKSVFERNHRDPRSLEPRSKAPRNTSNRKRISKETEKKIIEVRDGYDNCWGKEKIAGHLWDEYKIKVHYNTVNKYLHIHQRIDPKISLKNTKAWDNKKQREAANITLKVKFRPPHQIKDLSPGALIEKDMKYIAKLGQKDAYKTKDSHWYQHTLIDSFTRIRTLEIVDNQDSQTAVRAHQEAIKRFPFLIACENTDNGSENNGEFSEELQKNNIFHFYSNVSTPTDNPRVERSHLTDDLEFYNKGNIHRDLTEQKEALKRWEDIYNHERPHQALGYMTPMKFYELWKKEPSKAYAIKDKWQIYLNKQRIRLANSRKIKRKEQIEALMNFIDAKSNKNSEISEAKLQLINCQLCSMA